MRKLLFILFILSISCLALADSTTDSEINIGAAQGGSLGTASTSDSGINIGAVQTLTVSASVGQVIRLRIGRG